MVDGQENFLNNLYVLVTSSAVGEKCGYVSCVEVWRYISSAQIDHTVMELVVVLELKRSTVRSDAVKVS